MLLAGSSSRAEAAAPGTAVYCLTPLAAAAWALTGSKGSCMLLRENKGFLNSGLRLAAARHAPCTTADLHPWYSSAHHSPGLRPAGLEHKAASYQREHLSSAMGFAFLAWHARTAGSKTQAGDGPCPSVLVGAPSLCLCTRGLLGRPGFLGVAGRDTMGAHRLLLGQDGLRGCGSGTAVLPCSASCSKAEERQIFLYLHAAPF